MREKDPIQQRMELAERTGQQGEPRKAADLYQALGDTLREQLGPHHARTLDAYEGFVRWVEAPGHS